MICRRNTCLLLLIVTLIYNTVVASAFLSQSLQQQKPSNVSLQTQTSTHLNMKGSHRARFEKSLEDMMGNDWRFFRARLVAQEAVEKRTTEDSTSTDSKNNNINNNSKPMKAFGEPDEGRDEKQAKQEKFGKIFAAIFSNSNKETSAEKEDSSSQRSIFDGLNIGGATPQSMIPDTCEDPFVSEAELPVLLQPKVHIDKHRWAHPLSHIEPGCVLIANEKLGGVFHQTVVLIIEHNEGAGSTGIVINRYGGDV